MAKKSMYVCQTCGYESTGWLGKCPECDTWGSLVETVDVASKSSKSSSGKSAKAASSVALTSIKTKETKRISTKIPELDRVTGGGIVSGQVALIAGEPGIGKSTTLLQLAESLGDVLYVSGEESVYQIKLRADRLGIKKKSIQLMEETDIDSIVATIEMADKLKAVIVDSIQTMATSDLKGMTGSVGQVRECSSRLVRAAKATGIPVFIVGHVTKQGSVAGPSLLMHIVDTVLWFEGNKDMSFRLLRARKNRFGPTDEVGIFTMEGKGLLSVTDTSDIFLSDDAKSIPGSAIASIMEGTRPLLVEIQALVVPTKLAFPKRVAQGIDSKKLELLLAVLQRRVGLKMNDFDVYVNVVGGIKIKEPGIDLSLILSIASAYYDKPLPKKLVTVGEVGLLGEVRSVMSQDKRIAEARRLGYRNTLTNKDTAYARDAVSKFFK